MKGQRKREMRRLAGMLAVGLTTVGLHHVEDPRHARGKRRPLLGMLTAVMTGLLAGCKSLAQLELLTAQMSLPVRRRLRIAGRLPDTTLRDLLMMLRLDTLRAVLYRMNRVAHRRKQLRPADLPFGVIAMDGKHTTTRLTDGVHAQVQSGGSAVVRTLTTCLISTSAAPCLDAHPIPKEKSESSALGDALNRLLEAYGSIDLFRLVSTDAGITTLENAQLIIDRGLHYLFALKENQPTLLDEAHRLLAAKSADEADAETTDRLDNNRVAIRRLWWTDEMTGYHDWDHQQVTLRVQREVRREDGVVESCEDRYFITSCVKSRLTAEQWLRVVRGHWRVENDCHCTWDKVLREDEHPWIRAPHGMLAVMLLRRVAYNLLALYRNVSRRGEEKGATPWAHLMSWLRLALLGADESDIEGLRWPSILMATPERPPRSWAWMVA